MEDQKGKRLVTQRPISLIVPGAAMLQRPKGTPFVIEKVRQSGGQAVCGVTFLETDGHARERHTLPASVVSSMLGKALDFSRYDIDLLTLMPARVTEIEQDWLGAYEATLEDQGIVRIAVYEINEQGKRLGAPLATSPYFDPPLDHNQAYGWIDAAVRKRETS